MKTRSQAKKEKLDKVESKVPQLNEDVLGIILKHVIKKHQVHLLETIGVIEDHVVMSILISPIVCWTNLENFEWPEYLESNSRRLIHHTNVKLFPDCTLTVPNRIERHIKSKRDLDLLWETLKHFGEICFWTRDMDDSFDEETAAEFFQRLWRRLQGPTQLARKLEERLTGNTNR